MIEGSSIWLGQHTDSILLSLGDFGTVRAELTYDVFKNKSGFKALITSCELLLFGTHFEFLHRLNKDRLEELQDQYACKHYEDDNE